MSLQEKEFSNMTRETRLQGVAESTSIKKVQKALVDGPFVQEVSLKRAECSLPRNHYQNYMSNYTSTTPTLANTRHRKAGCCGSLTTIHLPECAWTLAGV
jgi:hypothetical protein